MSNGKVGPGRPPIAHRFRKGESGNPKGRPRGTQKRSESAFDIVIDRTLTLTQNGQPREVRVEEALQHKTYQDAIAGNRAARREILKMIATREQWFAAKAPNHKPPDLLFESVDPSNANEAMIVLGIAARDERSVDPNDRYERLLLEPWTVQLALRRGRSRSLSDQDVAEVKRCTRDPDAIRWPTRKSQ